MDRSLHFRIERRVLMLALCKPRQKPRTMPPWRGALLLPVLPGTSRPRRFFTKAWRHGYGSTASNTYVIRRRPPIWCRMYC